VPEAARAFLSDPQSRQRVRALLRFNELFTQVYHRMEILGRWQVPETGPAILVCNHISGLDPLFIQSVSPRVIVWMMAREYYDVKATNWVFRRAESIPVERTGRDLASTRAALRALDAGRILGIFPEGRIETDGNALIPFQTGVAMMAIKTGVPVYPAYLDGTSRGKNMLHAFTFSNRVRLTLGPAVTLETRSTDKDSLERATLKIYEAVAELKRQSDRQPR
jgi:1-acyl-sn-glycerol-3-phosphate acyltransferase